MIKEIAQCRKCGCFGFVDDNPKEPTYNETGEIISVETLCENPEKCPDLKERKEQKEKNC